MKPVSALFGAAIAVALLVCGNIAAADDFTVGALKIGNPWARATPGGASVGAGYLTITNTGKTSDRLVGGSIVPASRFEIHTTITEGGVAKMRQVKVLEIKPGETVELKPGGLHVMFMGLKQPLRQGERVPGTLVFERAGKVDIGFAVQPVGAPAAGHGGHSGH